MPYSLSWIYRNDSATQVQQGDTISVWVRLPAVPFGRAYFGFGASAAGTLSLVVAADTGQLILQDNSGYGFSNLSAVPQSYLANHWYRLAVAWGSGGAITGQLYDSNGTNLLNSVRATDNNIIAGGIAFLATWYDKYFDTVTVTRSGTQAAVRLDEGRPVPRMLYPGAMLAPVSLETGIVQGPQRPADADFLTPPKTALQPLEQSSAPKAPLCAAVASGEFQRLVGPEDCDQEGNKAHVRVRHTKLRATELWPHRVNENRLP